MATVELHPQEPERLALLRSLNLLDTSAEPVFDAIARLAARVLAAPIALVSLVDSDRQWFKAAHGLAVAGTAGGLSFCAHAVHADAALVIGDASQDPRCHDHALAMGAPHVRAYAGMPLRSSQGLPLGTLCVIDHVPRDFGQGELDALADLAELASTEIRHREAAVRAAAEAASDRRHNDALSRAVRASAAAHQTLQDREADLRAVLEHALDAYICIDESGAIVEWNRQAEATFGWRRDEAVGRPMHDLIIPPAFREQHLRGMAHLLRTGEGPVMGQRLELPTLTRDGDTIPCEVSINALPTARAGHLYFAFLHDITARKRVAQALAASEHRLRTVADNLPVLISYVDTDERFQFCNRTYDAWLGIDSAAAVGRLASEVFSPADYARRAPMFARALAGERVEFELDVEHEGRVRQLHLVYLPDVSPEGAVLGFYALVSDVTASKDAQRQLARLARTDTLTGLPNRRAFEEALDPALARARRAGHPLALLFLDIDHFKQINDTLGHGIGDEVLKTFAARLGDCVRGTDTVARLAGDEFVVILECLKEGPGMEVVARKIIQAMAAPFDMPDGRMLEVRCSIGAACDQTGSLSGLDLLAEADRMLYLAKSKGRNASRLVQIKDDGKGGLRREEC